MKRILLPVVLILALLFNPVQGYSSTVHAQAAATPCYVDDTATGLNNGSSWKNAYQDLQTAIVNLNCATIWVAEGTYFPSKTGSRAESFHIRGGLEIDGGYPNGGGTPDPSTHKTILSGDIGAPGDGSDNSYHVVTGDGVSSSAVLDGFIIQNGSADDDTQPTPTDRGGGIYLANSSPTLRNLVITENTALMGGAGIYLLDSSPTLTGVTTSNNTESPNGYYESRGGGMWGDGSSSPVLNQCKFIKNDASIAGGGFYSSGDPTLTDVTFTGNYAGYDGGGMESNGSATLTGVTFSGNSSGSNAGGLYVNAGQNTIRDSQFLNNSSHFGGGISVNSEIIMINSTIDQNTADRGGGGLFMSISSSGTLINLKVTRNGSISSETGWGGGIVSFAQPARFYNLLVADNNGTSCSGIVNNGNMRLVNATIAGNHAGTSLSTLCLDGSSSITRASNTIVWGNDEAIPGPDIAVVPHLSALMGFPEAAAGPEALAAAQITLVASILQDGCPATATCTGLVSGDPLFLLPAQRDYHISINSPAVNTGRTAELPADTYDLNDNGNVSEPLPVDLEGSARIVRGKVGLGAYEFQNQAVLYLSRVQQQP